jgi:hypothetical protein
MEAKKEKLRQLVKQAKQRDQEAEESAQKCIDILNESQEAVDKFIQETVMPTLNEIKGELEGDFERISIEQEDSSAMITIASGAKLHGISQHTKEIRYSLEVTSATRKAKGKLTLLNAIAGPEKLFLIAEKDVTSHNIDENIADITKQDIWDNFLAVYDKYANG